MSFDQTWRVLHFDGGIQVLERDGRWLLLHAVQSGLTCNWYAMFALTGDTRFMRERELKPDRAIQRTHALGFIERTWWNRVHLEQPCDWEALASTIPAASLEIGYRAFHISYRTGSLLHSVALLMPADSRQLHFVSDSAAQKFRAYSNRASFMRSRYGTAFLVSEILEAGRHKENGVQL